jgi:hypothetical protein
MVDKQLATSMPTDLSSLPAICESCVLGKQTKTPIPKTRGGRRAERLLRKVFSDITGPEDVQTPAGELYALNFVDDCSDKTWVYPLKKKSDSVAAFKSWKAIVEKETGLKVGTYCMDNGGEFTSKDFKKYLREAGVKHKVTAPYSSAQNGKVEHAHRKIMNRTHAIMADNGFPPKLWGECFLTSAYIKDRTPTRSLKNMTPFEAYYGWKPDITHLREIGCKAFVLVQSGSGARPKIYSRSVECTLVGYSPNSKAYWCYNKKTGCILVSRNVQFIESQDTRPRPLHPGFIANGDKGGIEDDDEDPPHIPTDPGAEGEPGSVEDAGWLVDQDVPGEVPEDNPPPGPRCSARAYAPSAAGATSKGEVREGLLDQVMREVREGAERKVVEKAARKEHANIVEEDEDYLLPAEMDDPRTYKQAMATQYAPQWDTG